MKRTTKRLVLDQQTVRTLMPLTPEQLRVVEGGNDYGRVTGRLECTNSWRPCCTSY